MFRGRYDYTVDDRGRVPIPRPYRSHFENEAGFLVVGNEGCLELYMRSEYERKAEQMDRFPDSTQDGRRVQRLFYSTAREVPLDKQARILIPANIREAVGLQNEVVVIGRGRVLEIWNKDRWEGEYALIKEGYSDALERVSEKAP